jgi:hypothetical protein
VPAAVVLESLSEMLSDPTSRTYLEIAAAVESADSVAEALVGTGVLAALGDDVTTEANAVAGVIPLAVDEAIMGALESAFERAVPVSVGWTLGERISVSVSEQPSGVSIQFSSPDGRTYV